MATNKQARSIRCRFVVRLSKLVRWLIGRLTAVPSGPRVDANAQPDGLGVKRFGFGHGSRRCTVGTDRRAARGEQVRSFRGPAGLPAVSGVLTVVAAGCVWFSGCISPTVGHGHHAHWDSGTQVTPVSYTPDEPAMLPVEKELEGKNSIDQYVQLALERNQEILAAQRAVQSVAETIPQAEALDDPMLIDTFQPIDENSVQTAAGRGSNVLTLSQKFPWFGKLRVRGEIAEQSAQIALTRLTQAQLKVTEQVRLACYDVQFNLRAIQITEEDKSLLGDLLMFAEARYRTGQTSQQDVLRAQVELDRIEDRLIQLRRQLRQSQADLAGLLHTSPESDLLVEAETPQLNVPDEIERLYEASVECRPELQERLHAIVQSQRSVELAELEYSPDVTAGIGWQAVTTDGALSGIANGHDNVAFLVGVNLPIWADKLKAGVREAEYRTMENTRRYDAVKDDTFRTIKRLVVQARALDEQTELFRGSIIPKSEQTLRVSTADYRVAKVDFEQIIDNWTDLLAFQINLIRLDANLGQTLASLERVIGCELAEISADADAGNAPVNPVPLEPTPPHAAPQQTAAPAAKAE